MLELKVEHEGKPVTLRLEHSLLAISKWEATHKKAFLANTQKTPAELVEYFEDMLVSPPKPELIYSLGPEQLEEITDYINTSRTASSVPEIGGPGMLNQEVVTSELMYYWLVALQIPFDVERWHISRLQMLVRITNFKQSPPEKQNKATMAARWRDINAKRKAEYGTTG